MELKTKRDILDSDKVIGSKFHVDRKELESGNETHLL